jgi:hypothetical protein
VRFFFLTVFCNVVFIRTTPLDRYQNGRSRGIAHVVFASKDGVVATMASVAQKPLNLANRDLRIELSLGNIHRRSSDPNSKLFYSGCDESEIETIFQQFSNSIISNHSCMLFTLSDSCTNNSHEVTLNSEGSPDRGMRPSWFHSVQ